MIRVKICGMRSADDVRACAAAGADALGFIFARSPRRLSPSDAQALTAAASPFVTTVGVFADDGAELVRAAMAACRLDVLQFSGEEPADFCGCFGLPTIVRADGRAWTKAELTTARAVALLVDGCAAGKSGGTGVLADPAALALARRAHPDMPIVLAGGLTPDNVAAIARSLRPDAIDVRSGVERDGRLDAASVRDLVGAVRAKDDER
jgi:phosphoribosylanthranilate isomerase